MTAVGQVSQVQLLTTERCNITCRHCAVPAEESPADGELTTEEWNRVLGIVAEAGVQSVVINGGEAFMRKDALALSRQALEAGIPWIVVITNGMLFNRDTAEAAAALQKDWPGFGIHVSVDGGTASTHDWMRGLGAFDRMCASIGRLLEAGGRIEGVNSVIHRGNVHEFEVTAELVASWSATMWTVFPNADLGRGVALDQYRLDRETWLDLYQRGEAISRTHGFRVGIGGPVMVDEWSEDEPLVPTPSVARPDKVIIGPDGDVFTCPPLRERSLGSAREVHAVDDWRAISAAAVNTLDAACQSCKYLLVCTNVDLADPLRPRPGQFAHPACSAPSAPASA